LVRMIHRYYAAVWLLGDVHAGCTTWASPADLLPNWAAGASEVSPVLVPEVSRRAWGLRRGRTGQELALSPLIMLPSAITKT
jgi:hypothetical protein